MQRHLSAVSVVDDAPATARPNGAAHPPARDTVAPMVPPPAELIDAQQLGNVGLLAAGLAHDLNNLLTVILGSAELARDHTPASSGAAPHLRTIELTVRRAGELCRAMLACARADSAQLENIDANALVRDTVVLLQTSRLAFHRVRLDLPDNLPPVPCRPAQLRQIVLNLLVNAADACGPRGGRIRISTTIVEVDARLARSLRPGTASAGKHVRLRVADDGSGIDEATMARLFTPYFSTKPHGRGLGLAALLEITRGHHGGVRVFSEAGRGSIFDVFLPLGAGAELSNSKAPAAGETRVPSLRGSVLVADDEDILRQSLSTFLGAQGLHVTAVADGRAALDFLEHGTPPDLLLLDVIMPRTGGLEVLATVRAAGHRMPVILMSGNAGHDLAAQAAVHAPVEVIAKPFSLAELTQLLGALLPARA